MCSRKCLPKSDLIHSHPLPIPQRSCFHRCSIKYLEALRFTSDALKLQTH